jgi:hypothetical protein
MSAEYPESIMVSTVRISGGGAGVDYAWEQRKLEARKMLENAAESPGSSACFVSPFFATQPAQVFF